ncbi:MAG: LysR family transcriptional regulator [Mycobacterium leprae]
MNLHYLRVYCEVAESGSITRAAHHLRISQPAVSIQIKRLEEEMGLSLLQPHGRGVQLTDAGRELATYARRLFAVERELEVRMEDRRLGRAGTVRIGATNTPGHFLMPVWASRLKQVLPGIEIQVKTDNSRAIFDGLHELAYDVAVMSGGWDEPGIHRELIWEDKLWFIVPRLHPLNGQEVTIAELAREPFLLRGEGSSTRRTLVALFELHGLPVQVGLVFAGMMEIIRAVEAGYGTSLVPSLAVREAVGRGALGRVHVSGVDLPFPLFLCTREGELPAGPAEQFIQLVRQFDLATLQERG